MPLNAPADTKQGHCTLNFKPHFISIKETKENLSVWKIASRLFGALHKIPLEKTSPKNTEHWQYSQLQFNHRLHKSCWNSLMGCSKEINMWNYLQLPKPQGGRNNAICRDLCPWRQTIFILKSCTRLQSNTLDSFFKCRCVCNSEKILCVLLTVSQRVLCMVF